MSFRLRLILVLSVSLALLSPAALAEGRPSGPVPAANGRLTGVVTLADGHTPSAYTMVTLYRPDGGSADSTNTSASGSYSITEVAPGAYRILLAPDDYGRADTPYAAGGWYTPQGLVDEQDGATPVEIVSGQTRTLNMSMRQGGAIGGQAYLSDGATPLTTYSVSAYDAGGDLAASTSVSDGSLPWVRGIDLDSTTNYLLEHLPVGTYQLKVDPSAGQYPLALGGWYAEAGLVQEQGHASWVAVITGTTTMVDVTLGDAGAISGHVYLPDGQIAASETYLYHVSAYPEGSYDEISATEDPSTGAYTAGCLAPGDYQVYIRANGDNLYGGWYSTSGLVDDQSAASLVVVQTNEITPLDLTLRSVGTISGKVRNPDGTRLASGSVEVSACTWPMKYMPYNAWATRDFAYRGEFTLGDLPSGSYYVHVDAAPYYNEQDYPHLRGGWYADGELTDDPAAATPIQVVSGQTTSEVLCGLRPAAQISGHVYDIDGVTPLQDFELNLFRQGYAGVSAEGRSHDSWDIDDAFAIGSLADGAYVLLVEPQWYYGESTPYGIGGWYSEHGLVQDARLATPVSVTLGGNVSDLDISLALGGALEGTVRLPDGQPLSPGVVQIYDEDWNPLTDPMSAHAAEVSLGIMGEETGTFSLHHLTPGLYRVWCSPAWASDANPDVAWGWYRGNGTTTGDVSQAGWMEVRPGETTSLDVTLSEGGSISGAARAPNVLTPEAGATVYVYDYRGVLILGSATATSDGSFIVTHLPAGAYKVRAYATRDHRLAHWIDVWYAAAMSTWHVDLADAVILAERESATGIDVTFLQGGGLKGQVLVGDGQIPLNDPLADLTIEVTRLGAEAGSDVCTLSWLTGGTYSYYGLPTGEYVVHANASGDSRYTQTYWEDALSASSAEPVHVLVGDMTEGIDFVLQELTPRINLPMVAKG